MTQRQHKHMSRSSKALIFPFRWGCAIADNCNPEAHEGLTHLQLCRCGATRRINVNGKYVEYGRWEKKNG